MTGWNGRTGILAALVLAAGLAAWALFQPHEDLAYAPSADGEDPPVDGPPAATGAARPARSPVATPGAAGEQGAEAGVQRLLPADAALEDLRDALALEGDARAAALREAWIATGRIAASRRKVLLELHELIRDESDDVLRGVATSALGATRTDENLRWLETRLAASATFEVRLGALIALARPGASAGRPRAGALRVNALGGLVCDYAVLPNDSSLDVELGRFLDDMHGERSREVLPILVHSVKTSARHAALLVNEKGTLRRFVATLGAPQRRALRDAALTHKDLPPSVRRTLEAVE